MFTLTLLVEKIASDLQAVSAKQREATVAQGFSSWTIFRHILLPQGLANIWQSIVRQYLGLLRLFSLTSSIGFVELTRWVRQIESYNTHAPEAFVVGTALYPLTGIVLDTLFTRLGPQPVLSKSPKIRICAFSIRNILHDR